MEYKVTDKIIDIIKINSAQGWSKEQGMSAICFELFKQKYNRRPDIFEIWGWDKDLIETTDAMYDKIAFPSIYGGIDNGK